MYESEVNSQTESSEQIPPDVRARFCELDGQLLERTVMPWSEHCTECVWPTCYSTCDLYSPRLDGRCRRFSDGMVRVEFPEAPNTYLVKIRFKPWGKLWTPGTLTLRSMSDAQKVEFRDYWIGKTLRALPEFIPVKKIAIQKRYAFKKRAVYTNRTSSALPTCFLLECYNPGNEVIRLSLTMRSVSTEVSIPFQKLIDLSPGFNRVRVPFVEVARILDLRARFTVDLVPNADQSETTLYFGLMDFVREMPASAESKDTQTSAKTIKCVVWDLDNTLWDGILVEDGADKLRLRPHIKEVLRTLDERGILASIVSKNNREEATAVLRSFGIEEYFLCPQISWQPKSQGIKTIARDLNIGVDSMLFVDDSEFELQEVRTAHPFVRTVNALNHLAIPEMEGCQVEVTAESRNRRKMYQVESKRTIAASDFGGDYLAFLRDCNLKLSIYPMTRDNLNRVHELTQRTNQMNFSGNRYERNILEQILDTSYLDTYVLDVEDRFGSYGIIGFCVVDNRVPLMTDLMFSCRVQSKRVEHAFLAYIIHKYIAITGKDFFANYRKTARNAPSGRVFEDLFFRVVGEKNGVLRLQVSRNQQVPDDQVIAITEYERGQGF